jgi:hypothetical protein
MRDSQAPATAGTKIFEVVAKWWVNTRSNNGAVTTAETIPEKSRQAPNKPLVAAL